MRLGDPKLPLATDVPRLMTALYDVLRKIVSAVNGHEDAKVLRGIGSPAGVVVANIGTLYVDTTGGVGTVLYVKEADNGAATGWAAK